jgi:hypothetical protein
MFELCLLVCLPCLAIVQPEWYSTVVLIESFQLRRAPYALIGGGDCELALGQLTDIRKNASIAVRKFQPSVATSECQESPLLGVILEQWLPTCSAVGSCLVVVRATVQPSTSAVAS